MTLKKRVDCYIYGAGVYGERALKLIYANYPDVYVKSIIDANKCGKLCGIQICRIDQVNDIGTSVIIAIKNFETVISVYFMLHKAGFQDIWWFYGEKPISGKSFLEEQCINCRDWAVGSAIGHVEMHIMDSCNLNCKGCSHFSPIFDFQIPDIKSRINDVRILSEKISYIHEFFILGGEPFLNPEIGQYVKEIRKILPISEITIVTNGLLIPSINYNVFELIKDNNVNISISEYRPVHRMIERIEGILKNADVSYEIRTIDSKTKFNRPLSLSNNSKYEKLCISRGCVTIWNGKIACCPTLMYISRFNEYFGYDLPDKGVLYLEDAPNGWELIEYLKKEVPLCSHCIKDDMEWDVCGSKPELKDFAVVE